MLIRPRRLAQMIITGSMKQVIIQAVVAVVVRCLGNMVQWEVAQVVVVVQINKASKVTRGACLMDMV